MDSSKRKDIIAAPATPGGTSAIAVIRVSGEGCLQALSEILRRPMGKNVILAEHGKMLRADAFDPGGNMIDECMFVHFRAPMSYTGEDMAEISCHGNPVIVGKILEALYSTGISPAKAGEFTKRAFMNGKTDLSGSEAVMDIIEAESNAALRLALLTKKGSVQIAIDEISDKLKTALARFFAYIDYPDDEIEDTDERMISNTLGDAAANIKKLLSTFERGSVAKNGIDTVILGSTNVGKSSVMNLITRSDVSIVTDIAGTTRDIIKESAILGGVKLLLSDTAGIRDTNEPIEKIGTVKALKRADDASLIIAVFDGSRSLAETDREILNRCAGKKAIAIINKSDLPLKSDINEIKTNIETCVVMSAKTGEGLGDLESVISRKLGLGEITDDSAAVISNVRHKNCLTSALSDINDALAAIKAGFTVDAVVVYIENALRSLGEITGVCVTEDIVAKIFQNFCVGK